MRDEILMTFQDYYSTVVTIQVLDVLTTTDLHVQPRGICTPQAMNRAHSRLARFEN